MIIKPTIYCLFEQSGTFKNAFKELGFNAYDYDILNDFGETDYVVDLFQEIENAYNDKRSIFDLITQNDLIFAFFPCTRFENQILLLFKGVQFQDKNLTIIEKLERDIRLHNELNHLYLLITKLAIVCFKRKLKLIIENPYSEQHYLVRYWALNSKVKDLNRWMRGDNYKKPTQYWFINCEPAYNIVWKCIQYPNNLPKKINKESNKVKKSLITKEYAIRFIDEFILTNKNPYGII